MAINSAIFKEYDVRGTYPDQLNDDAAYAVARAFVAQLDVSQVAVGRDMRLSSPSIAAAAIRGIVDQGAEAIDLGMTSSDELYFAVGRYGYQSGVMITASHNPGNYNGLKFCLKDAVPVSSQTGLNQVRDMVLGNAIPAGRPGGKVTKVDALAGYIERMHTFVQKGDLKPLRVVVDAGNGMAGMIVPAVFQGLPVEVIPLYFELDGHFPHHPASPIEPQNMADLQRAVLDHHADLGAAFDGDADRMFLVDEKGNLLDGSIVVLLVARSLLRKNAGAKILYNLICSRSVPELIAREGGHAVRTRVGHSFIKAQMRSEDAIFGGEHSGHFYYRDFYFADSGMISLLVCLEILSLENKPLSAVVAALDSRCRSGELNSHVKDIPAKLAELQQRYASGKIDHLDGITVQYDEWWFNVRASNTEPLLRLNVEATTCAPMEQKRDELLAVIRA
ncbi:MAG: phosphomannomutase/phosphoglucomutase [Chloroflexota bacterium]